MCGRVYTKSTVDELVRAFPFVKGGIEEGLGNLPPRYNGAPSLEYPLIVKESDMPGYRWMKARWGLVPSWMKEPMKVRPPINARGEKIRAKPMFKAAYRARRALMPIDGFFEWRAIKGQKVKKPYAIAMQSGEPFCVAAIWEERKVPFELGAVTQRTFAIITCAANDLVGQIHDRMPVIVAEADYPRWLSPEVTDPFDLIKPFPSELMKMWPISTRVNSPRNDDPEVLEPADD